MPASRHLYVAVFLSLLFRSAILRAEDLILPTDPRVIEANALLGDESQWDRAISLYSEALADDPDQPEVGLWIARILAWQGRYDESYAVYDTLLESDSPPPDARIERAEVSSWAGDYAEAEALFQSVLAADPRNARAVHGLARTYAWSGRRAEAEATVAGFLGSMPDGTSHQELEAFREELRAGLGFHLETRQDFIGDSDDFKRFTTGVRASVDLDFTTRLLLSTSYTGIRGNPSSAGEADADDAITLWAGVERDFSNRLRANAELGYRGWLRSGNRFQARGEAEYRHAENLALGFQLVHADFLEESDSLAAVEDALMLTSLRAWTWHSFNEALDGYANLRAGFIDDGNTRVDMSASTTYKPWDDRDVRFSFSASFVGYAQQSDRYYDPVVDASGGFSFLGGLPLAFGFRLEGEASLGAGYARQDGESGLGFVFGFTGGPTWTHASGFFVSLRGRYSRSQRSTAYTSGGMWLTFGQGF